MAGFHYPPPCLELGVACQFIPLFAGGRTWGTNPAPSIAFCGSTPAYPASVHRFSTTPSRATRVMRDSSTAVSCDTSCRLAPVTTIDNGTPRSSTSRCRLDPFFSPICGVATDGLLGKGGLVHRTVDCLPLPGDAHHIIVFSQTFSPKREEEAGLFPLPKICMNGTGGYRSALWAVPSTGSLCAKRRQWLQISYANLAAYAHRPVCACTSCLEAFVERVSGARLRPKRHPKLPTA